ncbi:antibiotic biosynthesis monooxygenase [Pleurocapsa sp. PCC 7319]|uniref:antibiotic biosynthesis monooxygenase n=1 Tax=Pleurocapsa sp. PCC 7319 TaxID=118161 RepID=UPI00034A43C3|nr:antibiotic biosynthesis monooxygenase [Pleurocapsa sp. PCC 7319]
MNYDTNSSINSHQPVTVLVTRSPRQENQKEFEQALADTIDAALEFPGHLGVTVLKPQRGESNDYRIIVKFASETDYQRWCRSHEAAYWFKILNRLEDKPPNLEVMTGLETWFTVDSSASRPMIPPPRYKMAIVTWIAIFVLIVLINLLLGSFLATLPMLLRSFLLTVGLVALMTYVVMPRMTRLFSGWLYLK